MPTKTDCCLPYHPQRVYCDSYDCLYGYALIDNAEDVKCKGGKCSKDQCCQKGEAIPKHTLRDVGDYTNYQKLYSTWIHFLARLGVLAVLLDKRVSGLLSSQEIDVFHSSVQLIVLLLLRLTMSSQRRSTATPTIALKTTNWWMMPTMSCARTKSAPKTSAARRVRNLPNIHF